MALVGVLVLGLVGIMTVLDDAPRASAAAPPIPGTGGGLRPGSVPAPYEALVIEAGSMCAAAPPAIVAAQIQQESNWNPRAVSSSGAQGISQFMPATWPNWSKPGESPFDPAAAIPAQARYDCAIARTMASAQSRGRLPTSLELTSLMLAGYNAGPTRVLAAHGIPAISETQNYVRLILASAPNFAGATGGTGGAAAGSFAAREIAAAKKYLGTPYAWAGGDYLGPTQGQCAGGAAANDCHKIGFDCSGLVLYAVYVASRGKIRLDHSADDQSRHGTPVPVGQLRPGDLIGFANRDRLSPTTSASTSATTGCSTHPSRTRSSGSTHSPRRTTGAKPGGRCVMGERRMVTLAAVVMVSLCACAPSTPSRTDRASSAGNWSGVGIPATRSMAASADAVIVLMPSSSAPAQPTSTTADPSTPGETSRPAPQRPRWASGAGAPAFPQPQSIDQHSADAVALHGARALASADTTVDRLPQNTASRAALAGWLTPTFARTQLHGSLTAPPGAQWDSWVSHRAYLVVSAALSGDDHPPDIPTVAARMVRLTERPVGRDGWRGTATSAVVAVVLENVNGVWRIDNDQPS